MAGKRQRARLVGLVEGRSVVLLSLTHYSALLGRVYFVGLLQSALCGQSRFEKDPIAYNGMSIPSTKPRVVSILNLIQLK